MYRSDRNKTCLVDGYQSVGDHLGGRMRFCMIDRFLQIQSGTKCCPCSAQNDHALLQLIGSDLDSGI
jgi:hypothetical protein